MDVELDSDDGRRIYEVDFEVGSKDYEYDIDAYTGKIIKYEIMKMTMMIRDQVVVALVKRNQ